MLFTLDVYVYFILVTWKGWCTFCDAVLNFKYFVCWCFDSTELNSNECPFNWGKTLPFSESLHIQELMILKRMSSEFCQPWRKIKKSFHFKKQGYKDLSNPFTFHYYCGRKTYKGRNVNRQTCLGSWELIRPLPSFLRQCWRVILMSGPFHTWEEEM